MTKASNLMTKASNLINDQSVQLNKKLEKAENSAQSK